VDAVEIDEGRPRSSEKLLGRRDVGIHGALCVSVVGEGPYGFLGHRVDHVGGRRDSLT
jgi:hypothetical protein